MPLTENYKKQLIIHRFPSYEYIIYQIHNFHIHQEKIN